MKNKPTCDLAADIADNDRKIEGVKSSAEKLSYGVSLEKIDVGKYASENCGLYKGRYVTLIRSSSAATSREEKNYFIECLSGELKGFLHTDKQGKRKKFLVVGLGNGYMTVDALGKKTVERILTTRGNAGLDFLNEVSAFSVGVSAITGIESYEVVKGLIEEISPDMLVCIDALSAFKTERIGRAYQITDAGIRAGAGGGVPSKVRFDRENLGVPVVSVGVPFVISAKKLIEDLCEKDRDFPPLSGDEDMYVTPRVVDAILSEASSVIAKALNFALNPQLSKEDLSY